MALVGLPRSGKSTLAKALSEVHGWPIVQPDAIRLAMHGQRYQPLAEPFIWAVAHTMVRALLIAGFHKTVIVDATNISKKRRDEWKYPGLDVRFLLVDTSIEECLVRAKAEGREDLIPVIERIAAAYEPLGADERRYEEA